MSQKWVPPCVLIVRSVFEVRTVCDGQHLQIQPTKQWQLDPLSGLIDNPLSFCRSVCYYSPQISSKTRGPGEKGVPRNHPGLLSQKLADFECRFPYESYGISGGPLFSRPLCFTADQKTKDANATNVVSGPLRKYPQSGKTYILNSHRLKKCTIVHASITLLIPRTFKLVISR